MKFLLILNDAPYGIERTYNGLRIGGVLAKRENAELKIFLMGDAVISAVNGQKVPAGYYNTQIKLSNPIRRGAVVGVCGTCRMPAEFRKHSLSRGRPPWQYGGAD